MPFASLCQVLHPAEVWRQVLGGQWHIVDVKWFHFTWVQHVLTIISNIASLCFVLNCFGAGILKVAKRFSEFDTLLQSLVSNRFGGLSGPRMKPRHDHAMTPWDAMSIYVLWCRWNRVVWIPVRGQSFQRKPCWVRPWIRPPFRMFASWTGGFTGRCCKVTCVRPLLMLGKSSGGA